MSVETISVIDADLARVNAAAQQLAAALAQEHTGSDVNPSVAQIGHAAVQAAEATLAQAEAALHADQAAAATAPGSSPTATTASHFVTDPGGIVA